MNGRWHLDRTGEQWRARRADMRLVIATADMEAVGFNIPVAEFQSPPQIGPDLLAESFDVDEAVKRLRLVYRRAGQPCRTCGRAIEMRRQGSDARSTYWCPHCQP